MGDQSERRRSRPDRVDEAYLAQVLIDECLSPAAGPDVARAIISMLVTAGSLAPSLSDGLAFASRPDRTTDLPSAVAQALFDEFQSLLDTDRMPWFAARSGRLLRPGAITSKKDFRGWRQIDDPLLIFDCHQDDPLRELLSEARNEFDRLTWDGEAIVAEFADRRIGSLFAGFLLRDVKGRIKELDAAIARRAKSSISIAAHADASRAAAGPLIASHSITQVTKRDIIQAIQERRFDWRGRLDDLEFLAPLYDLDQLPSRDRRFKNARDDIWQHRVNNPDDLPPNWIFDDPRFDPLRPECEDDEILRFLCRTLHPEVRPSADEARQWAGIFNGFLKQDGWQLIEDRPVSGRPTFVPHRIADDNREGSDLCHAPPPGAKTEPTFVAAKALFKRVAANPKDVEIRAPDIYSALEMARSSLNRHENGPTEPWSQSKLDLVRYDKSRQQQTRLYSRESVLRWLAAHFGVATEAELTASGVLPASPPRRPRK